MKVLLVHPSALLYSEVYLRLEPLGFYLDLVRYPLSQASGVRALALSGLMCVGQVANAAGYFRQSFAR